VTAPVLAKEDPSTDNQEDSGGNKSALEDSKKKAEEAEGVSRGKQGGGAFDCLLSAMHIDVVAPWRA